MEVVLVLFEQVLSTQFPQVTSSEEGGWWMGVLSAVRRCFAKTGSSLLAPAPLEQLKGPSGLPVRSPTTYNTRTTVQQLLQRASDFIRVTQSQQSEKLGMGNRQLASFKQSS